VAKGHSILSARCRPGTTISSAPGSTDLINLNYLATGGYTGRQDFLAGGLDYVLSGVPFTPAELAQLPGGAADPIDAPVQVAAMGVLMSPLHNSAAPGQFAIIRQLADGTVQYLPQNVLPRVPSTNLAAMLFNFAARSGVSLRAR